MKRILVFGSILFLYACSDNNPNQEAKLICPINTSTNIVRSANSIQVTITSNRTNWPSVGVPVQLDKNGQCLLTDNNGFVRFDGLSADTHDIHVFGSPNLWDSVYYLDSSIKGLNLNFSISDEAQQNSEQPITNSFIDVSGTIENKDPNSTLNFSYLYKSSDKQFYRSGMSNTNLLTSYKNTNQFEHSVGSTIDNEILIFESLENPLGFTELIDAFEIPKFTTLTTNSADQTNTRNVIFQPLLAKPIKSRLITFGTINYPVGLSFSILDISGLFKSNGFISRMHPVRLYSNASSGSKTTVLPSNSITESYLPSLTLVEMSLSIKATLNDGTGRVSSWTQSSNQYLPSNKPITITPKSSTILQFPSNLIGDTITWNTVDVPVERQYIRIGRTQERSAPWRIRVMGNVGSIELPTIPNGINPIFVSDVEYNISVSANYLTTIQQQPYQYEDESYQAISTWIR